MVMRPPIRWRIVLLTTASTLLLGGAVFIAPHVGFYLDDSRARDVTPRLLKCSDERYPSALEVHEGDVLLAVESFPYSSPYTGAAVYIQDGSLFVRTVSARVHGPPTTMPLNSVTQADAELDRGIEPAILRAAASLFAEFKAENDEVDLYNGGGFLVVRFRDQCGTTLAGNHGAREISLLLSALLESDHGQVLEAVDAVLGPPRYGPVPRPRPLSSDYSVRSSHTQRLIPPEVEGIVVRCHCPIRSVMQSENSRQIDLHVTGRKSSSGYHGAQEVPTHISAELLEFKPSLLEDGSLLLESRESTWMHHAFVVDEIRVVVPTGHHVSFDPVLADQLEGRAIY